MSLLNPPVNQTPVEVAVANLLRRIPYGEFSRELVTWQRNFDLLWKSPDPAAVLASLGTDAAELFSLSSAKVQFLETLKPGCTADRLATMPDCTIHPDGTVTINPA